MILPGSYRADTAPDFDDYYDPEDGLCDCCGEPVEMCPNNFDCGMMPDGTCMLAGTEDCDWECPFHD